MTVLRCYMRIQIIDHLVELYELRAAWQQLDSDCPLLSWEWLASWWEAFGEEQRLCVLTCHDDAGKLNAIAPWYLENEFVGQSIQCLGSGNACTDYMRLLVAKEADTEAVSAAVANYMRQVIRGELDFRLSRVHTVKIDGAQVDAPWLQSFTAAMSESGFRASQRPIESSWVISLDGGWDAVIGRMSSGWRRKARKAAKRISSGKVIVHGVDGNSSEADFEVAFDILRRLHQRRRAELNQEGCFADPRFERFLRTASRRLLANNRVQIQWCESEDRPIAAQFQLLSESTVSMYQSGIDPDAMGLEPGYTMLAGAIESAIDAGFEKFDFLRGDEAYKAGWGGRGIPLARMEYTSPTTASRLRGTLVDSARGIRDLARSKYSAHRKP